MRYRKKIRHNANRLIPAIVFLAIFAFAIPMAGAAGTPAGTAITNQASATYQDASANNYTAVSNTTTVTVNAVYGVSLTYFGAIAKSGPSGTNVYYSYRVTNTGNDNNTFALAAPAGAPPWTTFLYADDGAGAGGVANDNVHQSGENNVTASTGVLTPDASYGFFVAVQIPVNTPNGTTNTTTLTVTGAKAGASDDATSTMTTTAQAPSLTILKNVKNLTTNGTFDNTAVADPGQTLEYRIQVTNSGATAATSVTLTDTLNANLTYVANSMRIGPANSYGGGGNNNPGDGTGDGVGSPCAIDACGQGHFAGSTVTSYLGTGATDGAAGPGGSLSPASTVYVYYHATVK